MEFKAMLDFQCYNVSVASHLLHRFSYHALPILISFSSNVLLDMMIRSFRVCLLCDLVFLTSIGGSTHFAMKNHQVSRRFYCFKSGSTHFSMKNHQASRQVIYPSSVKNFKQPCFIASQAIITFTSTVQVASDALFGFTYPSSSQICGRLSNYILEHRNYYFNFPRNNSWSSIHVAISKHDALQLVLVNG